jgi:hypothetical protein
VTSKHGLAVFFASVIAAAVAFGATYPRWHETRPAPAEPDLPGTHNTVPPVSASSVLPSIPSSPATSAWAKLSSNQRLALAPFAHDWDSFSDSRKQKWLKIATQYPKMSSEAQNRLHQRMTEWVRMSPDQRRIARENFQLSKSVSAQQRQKAWATYQQLPEDQKKKLEASDRKNRRPTVVSAPLTGKTEVKDLNTVRHTSEAAKPAATSATTTIATPPVSHPGMPPIVPQAPSDTGHP